MCTPVIHFFFYDDSEFFVFPRYHQFCLCSFPRVSFDSGKEPIFFSSDSDDSQVLGMFVSWFDHLFVSYFFFYLTETPSSFHRHPDILWSILWYYNCDRSYVCVLCVCLNGRQWACGQFKDASAAGDSYAVSSSNTIQPLFFFLPSFWGVCTNLEHFIFSCLRTNLDEILSLLSCCANLISSSVSSLIPILQFDLGTVFFFCRLGWFIMNTPFSHSAGRCTLRPSLNSFFFLPRLLDLSSIPCSCTFDISTFYFWYNANCCGTGDVHESSSLGPLH